MMQHAINRNVVRKATTETIARDAVRAAEKSEEEWDHYASMFHCVCVPVNDLAITLVKETIEMLKPTKYWRQNIKHSAKLAWKKAESYRDLLMDESKHNIYGDRRQFLTDFLASWRNSISNDVIIFRECISSYLLTLGIDGYTNHIIATVCLSYIILDYSVHLWDQYWQMVRTRTGKDYSTLFKPARLADMLRQWYEVMTAFDPKNKLNLDNDKNCVNAFKVIQYKCTGSDLINKAGNAALDLNEDVRQCVLRLEEESEDKEETKQDNEDNESMGNAQQEDLSRKAD